MTAIVTPFALSRRAEPSAGYEALRQFVDQRARRASRRVRASSRWTGSSDVVEAPARFVA